MEVPVSATPLPVSAPTVAQEAMTCFVCHQPILPSYYFCPNCGTNLHPKPLPTDFWTQLWLYVFSVALPFIAYIAIGKWKGIKYLRSSDQKAQTIGAVATTLIVVSTLGLIWYSYVWTQQLIQSTVSGINSDFKDL